MVTISAYKLVTGHYLLGLSFFI